MKPREALQQGVAARTLVDRLVGWWSPARGLERLKHRALLASATGAGGYTGGRRERRPTKRWRPGGGSADADTLPDLPDLRARSRDLVRNTPIATGAIATVVTNVVGDGLQLQASIDRKALGLADDAADQWEEDAEREWAHFCKSADFTRVQPFAELQALALRAQLESGDVLIVRRYRKDAGDVYGTKLQVIEADRLCNEGRVADSATLAGGVQMDTDGVPQAYHITDRHPGSLPPVNLSWSKVPARTPDGEQVVLHLYERQRPDLTRGAPYLAPVIEHLKQLGDYSDAEVTAAVVSAMVTVFIETPTDDDANPVIGEADSTLEQNEVKLGNGAVIGLAPGEKATLANPTRPNDKFDPFVQAFLRQVGVALELPFELLIKHFTASYSASRAALEMAWQFFRRRRCSFARQMCQTVYQWVIGEAIATGRLAAPGYFTDPLVAQAYCGANWIGPNRPSLDPVKEATADAKDIETGVKTREQVCLERTGGEWSAKIGQLGKEKAAMDAAGLKPAVAAAPGAPPNGDQPAPNHQQDDEKDDEQQTDEEK